MAGFNKGQTFLDKSSTILSGTKGKYFIALSEAEYDDDLIVCFVMNTEHRIDKYHFDCNKNDCRYIIKPGTFSFIDRPTSIMLIREVFYKYNEMYQDNIVLLDIAEELLLRQIKNCIDRNFISPKAYNIIQNSFKS
jgi:hypothetical protein